MCIFAFLAGVILLALPITILGGNFNQFYNEWEEDSQMEMEALRRRASITRRWKLTDKAASKKGMFSPKMQSAVVQSGFSGPKADDPKLARASGDDTLTNSEVSPNSLSSFPSAESPTAAV